MPRQAHREDLKAYIADARVTKASLDSNLVIGTRAALDGELSKRGDR